MVKSRRFLPLIVLVFLGMLGLIARLYQVQIVEHEIWAGEARNLVRNSQTIPYLRGKISDRDGEVFVQDEQSYAVRFIYRKFRREHALGQVAHARSVLEHRSVSLQDAAVHLEEWGLDVIESRAGALLDFAEGKAVELGGLYFPEVGRGESRRRSRAAELSFYTQHLLQSGRLEWSEIKKALKKGKGLEKSWVELVAAERKIPVREVRATAVRRMNLSLKRLEQLAVKMNVVSVDGRLAVTSEESLWFLIEGLDVKRREIEEAIAKDLFEEAAGFDPGRIDSEVLLSLFDLSFVTESLGWNASRLDTWAQAMRRIWLDNRRTFHVPRAQISAGLRHDRGELAEDALIGELAVLFSRRPRTPREARARTRKWPTTNEVAVFAELGELFDGIGFGESTTKPLPFLRSELRSQVAIHGWSQAALQEFIPFKQAETVAQLFPPQPVEDWRGDLKAPWEAPYSVEEAASRILWQLNATSGQELDQYDPSKPRDKQELIPWLEHLWEAQFQGALNNLLAYVRDNAMGAGFPVPLKLTEERADRARKKLDYFVRDRGSRPERILDNPADVVINTLTRYVHEYAGFEVEPRTRRLAMALDRDGVLVARELIGVVRESTLSEVLEQQYGREAFDRILTKNDRSLEEAAEGKNLVSELYRADEVHGTSGVEGLMDKRLRGRNGFTENEGLQQRSEHERSSLFQPREDGEDVRLTLSIDLQKAAQETIENPVFPLDEDYKDPTWFDNPVGAIVMATVDGQILAAASGPKLPGEPSPFRDGERAYNYERTLRMPLFQPMGSIFKPFVAAYALGRLGLNPDQEFECLPRWEGPSAGWGRVACHSGWGHQAISLDVAIHQSCNAYFAQAGELFGGKQHFIELAHMFGFDMPTGVRDPGLGRGLYEMHLNRSFHLPKPFSQTDMHRAANGLAVIEATPVQVARAVAGIATGVLPRMRLVQSVGGDAYEAEGEAVDLPRWALERVREAMRGVITEGSGQGKGLSEKELNFQLAGKTGSADYKPMSPGYLSELRLPTSKAPEMRKHTWFIGFFPAQRPTTVVVIYCHDIGVTSSHSAVYVASQFLSTPAVQAYVQGAMK